MCFSSLVSEGVSSAVLLVLLLKYSNSSLLGGCEGAFIGYGRSELTRLRPLLDDLDDCACTEAAACFKSEDVESDFCSITSDTLRFFRIGFLLMNEPLFERYEGGVDVSEVMGCD
jgi:hypothetical protein